MWHAGHDWCKATDIENGICFSFCNQKKEQTSIFFYANSRNVLRSIQ
ncbi:MAG: hypothetical protein RHS_3697 [Robinsoniella sp. RHS]|nr:MAG: hypothetical protein RHS_3697 [Robinsoniella sp. RHS]